MKDDIDKLQKENKYKEILICQQENITCHTSKDSKLTIEILLRNNYIEWPKNYKI